MKLDKAIALGKDAVDSLKQHKHHDHADAVQLLIEGARRIQEARIGKPSIIFRFLPGETEHDSPP